MPEFHLRVNGGKVRKLKTASGVYQNVALAAVAMFDLEIPSDIEIWAPSVTPEYGPYHYRVSYDGEILNRLQVETLSRTKESSHG